MGRTVALAVLAVSLGAAGPATANPVSITVSSAAAWQNPSSFMATGPGSGPLNSDFAKTLGPAHLALADGASMEAGDFPILTTPDTTDVQANPGPAAVFRGSLTGASQAAVDLASLPGGGRAISTIGHPGFLSDPAPVPEPGTWLLIATGIAGVVRRSRQTSDAR